MSATKRARFSVNISDVELEKIKDIVGNSEFSTISEFCSKATSAAIKEHRDKLKNEYRPTISNGNSIRHYRNSAINRDMMLTHLLDNPGNHTIDQICEGLGYENTPSRTSNMYTTMKTMMGEGWVFREVQKQEFPLKNEKFDPEKYSLEYLQELHKTHGTHRKAAKFLNISKSSFTRWITPEWREKNGSQIRHRTTYVANPANIHVRRIIRGRTTILLNASQLRIYMYLSEPPLEHSMKELINRFNRAITDDTEQTLRQLKNHGLVQYRINGNNALHIRALTTDKLVIKDHIFQRDKIIQ
ncbi:hypothetical protein LCGC14_0303030 [marine sediment metagenome]|uniref:Uncharacterized protein n=1 Tax=marine sediment metagenome TaxID=412755 RepID=A0A0F9U6T5_9ZZZZ